MCDRHLDACITSSWTKMLDGAPNTLNNVNCQTGRQAVEKQADDPS